MKPTTIMIIEHNPNLRQILWQVFVRRGYLAWTCQGVEMGRCLFEAVLPAIVILDVDSLGALTISLIDEWRETSPQTRIILRSASFSSEEKAVYRAWGAENFWSGPFALGPLFEILDGNKPRPPAARQKAA